MLRGRAVFCTPNREKRQEILRRLDVCIAPTLVGSEHATLAVGASEEVGVPDERVLAKPEALGAHRAELQPAMQS